MLDATRTTTHLLEGLHDPGHERVWQEFDARYRPIIFGFARRLGLDHADAADVAQETLLRFLRAYTEGGYERSRGRLRSWIIGIARRRIQDHYRSGARRPAALHDDHMVDLAADEELEAIWSAERRRAILIRALQELRRATRTSERSIDAFEAMALGGEDGASIARRLDMTLDDVYQAKNRVAGRLRKIIARLEAVYEEEA